MAGNKEIVQHIYQALSVGDIAAAFGHLDADIEWIEAAGFPYGGTYRGHTAVIDGVFKKLGSEWENWSAVPAEFVADAGTVVVIGEYSGTCRATGKSFTAPYVHVWKLAGEKVISFVQHTDTLLVDRAMKTG
jgi:ketosteroid isomerase-like protein